MQTAVWGVLREFRGMELARNFFCVARRRFREAGRRAFAARRVGLGDWGAARGASWALVREHVQFGAQMQAQSHVTAVNPGVVGRCGSVANWRGARRAAWARVAAAACWGA